MQNLCSDCGVELTIFDNLEDKDGDKESPAIARMKSILGDDLDYDKLQFGLCSNCFCFYVLGPQVQFEGIVNLDEDLDEDNKEAG